ncbi:hypothetical protein SAMN02745866_02302 [Alteromonadaceae bacterium Bs31]|nr:hypothetical protein SAMN02745866_02302 [Alteromonadaceae bacterium Bs31]
MMPKLHHHSAKPATKTDWKVWEADILVGCGLKHQFVSIHLPRSGETLQSFIHGFDLQSGLLLLDSLYPTPTHKLLKGDVIWIQIRCEHGFYNLKTQLKEIDGYRGGEMLTVSALYSEVNQNRRWNTRVFFDVRKGPEAEFQLLNDPLQKASVANLSRWGAQLEVYGKDLKQPLAMQNKLQCLITFNDHFQMTLNSVVKQCKFLRKPCCHSQIRVQFVQLGETSQARLDTFIHSIAAPLNVPSSAEAQLSNFAVA